MTGKFFDNWTTQLRKGLLELCVLRAIRGGSRYGYDIVRRLRGIEGLVIGEGTIYPILGRFKREGLVATRIEESSEGPPRKTYQLTDRGTELLARMNDAWRMIQRGVESLEAESGQ